MKGVRFSHFLRSVREPADGAGDDPPAFAKIASRLLASATRWAQIGLSKGCRQPFSLRIPWRSPLSGACCSPFPRRHRLRLPAVGPWRRLRPLPLFEAEAASAGGSVYVFAGFDNQKIQVTEQVESYDAASGALADAGAALPRAETHVGTATDGRVVYFAGGFRGNWVGQPSSDVWEFDTSTMTWSRGPSLPAPCAAGGLVLVGRQLHFFGGLQADGRTDSADHWVLDLDHPDAGWVARGRCRTRATTSAMPRSTAGSTRSAGSTGWTSRTARTRP